MHVACNNSQDILRGGRGAYSMSGDRIGGQGWGGGGGSLPKVILIGQGTRGGA